MTKNENENIEFYEVNRQAHPVDWEVDVPGSKSITNRALLLAALTDGTVELENVQFCDDSMAFLGALSALGFSLRVDEEECRVVVEGCGGRIPRDEAEIDVGSAGTAARFLSAMLGLSEGTYRIRASEQMQRRPMGPLFDALRALGAQITWCGQEQHLPVDLKGAAGKTAAAKEKEYPDREPGGSDMAQVSLDLRESTQFLSALLMSAPLLPCGLCIHIAGEKKSGPYVDMTRRMMRSFGAAVQFADEMFAEEPACASMNPGDYCVPQGTAYHGTDHYLVEPDVSAACYFYAAAAVTGGSVRVNRVYTGGLQGDLKFLAVLEQMGCRIRNGADGITVTGPAAGNLHGISVDMRDFSDQALTLAAIAPYADGPVEITNIAHVRGQESDRIRAIVLNLQRAGISCEERPDGVRIEPGKPQPCTIESFGDHRVAMAFSVMGLGADGIVIGDPGCCAKTFPDYFNLLDALTKTL